MVSVPKKINIIELVMGLQQTDPRVFEAFTQLNNEINNLYNEVFPVQQLVALALIVTAPSRKVLTFTSTVGPEFIYLVWTIDDPNIKFYEIRRQIGLSIDWDTADFVTETTTLSAILDPLLVGTYTYLIKTKNNADIYQVDAALSLTITILSPLAPTLSGQVIDNNVLLFWTVPAITSFRIREFKVYKNDVLIGINYGTFATFFELLSGTYKYSVSAVDIIGNEGPKVDIELIVNQPPDFELEDERNSTFSGTKVDAYIDGTSLIVDIITTETWEGHFLNNTWDQIQDQLDAGFPVYLQPADSVDVASYEETIDYGVLINRFIFQVLTSSEQIAGQTTFTCQIDYKVLAGDAWTSAPAGFSAYIPSARYIRVKLIFTSSDATSLLRVTQLKFIANVKQEIDSGQISALAVDASGTVVTFNKAFLDVKSITAEVKQIEPYDVVVDFVDIPNPVSFKVLVFDNSGIRRDSLVTGKHEE